MYKKFIAFCVLAGLLFAPSAFAADTEQLEIAPFSQEFLNWRGKTNEGVVPDKATGEVYATGYIPDPLDLSHLKNNPPKIGIDKTQGIPETFDSRTSNSIPEIRDQNPWGTCWAFAAIGGLESNYLKNKLGTEIDLSEFHLAYFTYGDSGKGKSFGKPDPNDHILDQGGNATESIAFLARLSGPTDESSLPYPNSNYKKPSENNAEKYPRTLRLKEALTLDEVDDTNRDTIKSLIMQYGAVQISYYAGAGATSPRGTSTTAYFNNTQGTVTNHAVLLIGWDDNFSRNNFNSTVGLPNSDGAWIVRNSWGTFWGNEGYFYMSYEQYTTRATVYVAAENDSTLIQYGYDDLGNLGAIGYGSTVAYGANVFQSSRKDEQIKHVGFYTTDNNAKYEVSIYKLGKAKPSSPIAGTLAYNTSGSFPYAGYHTVDVSSAVSIPQGEYFSVVVKFETPSYRCPLPIETEAYWYNGKVYAKPNIESGSYRSSNGSSWLPCTTENICIKAFTSAPPDIPAITTNSDLPDAHEAVDYDEHLQASGADGITFAKGTGNLPKGITIAKDGKISGKPTQTGDFTFTVTAKNKKGNDSKTFNLSVIPAETPVISMDSALKNAIVGEIYTSNKFELKETPKDHSTDEDEKITWTVSGTMPAGVKFDPSTLTLSGTPTKAGTSKLTITAATLKGKKDTKQVTLTVYQKPSISNASFKTGALVGKAYSDTWKATGTAPITWKADGLPGDLTLNEKTGAITGTPKTSGTFNVTIKATNFAGEDSKQNVALTIKDVAPKITTSKIITGKVNELYTQKFEASGTGDITWEITGELPSGLSFDHATKTLTGTTTKAWNNSFTLKASNSGGDNSKSYKLIITGIKPSIKDAELYDGAVGIAYPETVFSADGTPDITFTVTGLPSGLEYKDGKLQGTPTKAGKASITVKATNASGSDSKKFTFNINAKPEITTTALKAGTVDKPYKDALKAKGIATWNVEKLPEGLEFDPATGAITGTPEKATNDVTKGDSVIITATNSAGVVSKDVKIIIKDVAPKITTAKIDAGDVNEPYEVTFVANGTGNIKWEFDGDLPNSLSFDASTSTISGTPVVAWNGNITVTASNTGGTAKKSYKLVINGKKPKIITTSLPDGILGNDYTETEISADGTPEIKFTVTGLPKGLEFNKDNDNKIKGKPEKDGKFTASIKATSASGSDAAKITFTISSVPAISTTSLAAGTVGKSYSATLKATGTAPIKWSYKVKNGESLPEGFTFDSSKGILKSNKTNEALSIDIEIGATNAAKTVSKDFVLAINAIKPTLSGTLKKGTAGKEYNSVLKVKGTEPIIWSISGLPDDLEIDFKDGTFSGTPEKAFNGTVSVTVSNDELQGGGSVTKDFALVINAVAPKIVTSSIKNTAQVNEDYSAELEATGTDPIKWSISGAPKGFDLESQTGKTNKIIGKADPGDLGKFTIVVSVENDTKKPVTKKFTLTVVPASNTDVLDGSIPESYDINIEEISDDEEIYEEDEESTEPQVIVGPERNESSLTTGELKALEDYTIVAVLPEIEVTESGQYDFEVELNEDAPVGAKLLWFAFPKNSEKSEDDEIVDFIDETGAIIEEVPESKFITVSPWLTEGIKYAPVIAVENE